MNEARAEFISQVEREANEGLGMRNEELKSLRPKAETEPSEHGRSKDCKTNSYI